MKNPSFTSSRVHESFEQFYQRHFAILRQYFNNNQNNNNNNNNEDNTTHTRFDFNKKNWDPLSLFDAEIWTSIVVVAIGSLWLLLGQVIY